jgi:hypothetical protein
MNYKNEIYLILALIIILLPVLYFPLSSDHVIFIMGGKTISDGGKLYTDFIDIKSPLIYYLFAGIYKLFGTNEIFYRLFDFIWQLLTAVSLYLINFKILRKQNIAILTSIIYVFLYSTLNFSQTLQCETLAILPLTWAIFLYITKRWNWKFLILTGLLLGLIAGLKYTFVVLFIGFIAHLFFSKIRNKITATIVLSSGFLIGLCLSLLPLIDYQILSSYQIVLSYMKFYIGITQTGMNLVSDILKQTGIYFGDFFSLLIFLLMFIAIFNHFREPWKNRIKFNYFTLLLLLFGLLLFSVFIESKLTPYHFSRIFLPASVLAASGIIYIYYTLRPRISRYNLLNKILFAFTLLFFMAFSPLPRWFNLAKNVMTYYQSESEYDKLYTRIGHVELNRVQQKKVSDFINKNANADDKMIVMAIGSNQIYLFSKLNKFSKFGQSQYYLANNVPEIWRKMIIDEVVNSNWLVIQNNDNHKSIRGIDKSSWELIQANSQLWALIENDYILQMQTEEYRVFYKKK